MKKKFLLCSLIVIPFLANCNNGGIDMPKSPFDDHYARIGMQGVYGKTDDMSQADYNAIKTYINAPNSKDVNVKSYHRQEEIRDLKYAYFGKESSTISQCSMTSRSEDLTRYKNRVFINTDVTDQQIQQANGGIQKTKLALTDYTFDSNYDKETLANKYIERIKTKNNDETEVVTEPVHETEYGDEQIYQIFGLKPYNSRIKSHFIEDGEYKFKLLANNNNAVYYMTKNEKDDPRYLIKEGYSLFSDFHTTMGRSYKAQDNYFYEGILEKYKYEGEETFRFTHFRFYHELLILSKSIDGSGVPVLYLDKPVLIEFSETTYSNIEYAKEEDLDTYTDPIPPGPSEN